RIECRTANSEQRAASSEHRTANSEQRTANSEQRAANSEQRAASSEQRAASSEQRAANSEQRAASSEQRAASSEGASEIRRLRGEVARLSSELAMSQRQTEESTEVQNNIVPEEFVEREARATSIDVTHTIELTSNDDNRLYTPMKEMPIVPEYQDYPSFFVQFRGQATSGLTQVNVAKQTSLMENINLALMYQLSPQHIIGVELGNESFPMTFEGMRNGQLIRYEQQPVSTWAGITYRYSFAPIGNSSFTPFAQGLIGGSQFGPLGRVSGGLQYSPAGPLTFMLGIEGTSMAYTYQDTWFTSNKLGLTYGMAVRF
ncbi:MAG: hypothetical protein ACK5BQ_05330, partial [Ignavibacteria bacterium]